MNNTTSRPYLDAKLNDKRLTKRFNKILADLPTGISGSISQAMESKAANKGAYRFFHNKKVNPQQLLSAHTDSMELATQEQGYCLCLSDTTTLDYTNKRGSENLGYLTQPYLRGMYLHNDLIISKLGQPLGLLKQDFNNRSKAYFGNSSVRKNWPLERKESVRWLNSFNAAQNFSEQNDTDLIWVADREADIMDIYAARWNEKAHLLVRAQHDRCLDNSKSKLFSYLKQQPIAGNYEIEIIHPQTLKMREAKLAVRFCSVQLSMNTKLKHKKQLGNPSMNAIEVYEVDAPQGIEKPIRWVLLTTLPILNFEQALGAIRIYVKRWIIERFHYLLKTGGANIEQLQLEQPRVLQNVITIYSITVSEIMKIRYLAESQPDMSVYQAGISPKECEVLYAYAHAHIRKDLVFDYANPPTVWEFCRVLGMIGGFIPRKRQPLPGLKILTRATEKFNLLLQAYDVYMSMNYKDVGCR